MVNLNKEKFIVIRFWSIIKLKIIELNSILREHERMY